MNWDQEDVKPCVKLDAEGNEVQSETPQPPQPPPAGDCSDPAYAAAHPDDCRSAEWIEVRPSSTSIRPYDSIQFTAVLHSGDSETVIENSSTSGIEWSSSSNAIMIIGVSGGSGTGIAAGVVTITATFHNLHGYAQVQVMDLGETCSDKSVHVVVAIDCSRSMSQSMGQGGSKLDYAKMLAARFISEIDFNKDYVGLLHIGASAQSSGSSTFCANSLFASPSEASTKAALIASVNALKPCSAVGTTDLVDAVTQCSEALGNGDINVLLLLTDGFHTGISGETIQQLQSALLGKDITVMVVAIRSWGMAYETMLKFASGGFFLSATPDTYVETQEFLSGMKGYLCLGNCAPQGDTEAYRPSLNYASFTNWDVSGMVDLIGEGSDGVKMFDFLPGNGMYVDLAGSASPWLGCLRGKASYVLDVGVVYTLTVRLAGNQREDVAGYKVRVWMESDTGELKCDDTYTIDDYKQDFTDYDKDITGFGGGGYKICVAQTVGGRTESFGCLLASVTLKEKASGTVVFSDSFNLENLTYIPPRCITDTTDVPAGGSGLINIAIYDPNDSGSDKTGAAAAGTAGDTWNLVESPEAGVGFGITADLVDASGAASGAKLRADGIGDAHGTTVATDAMMARYVNSGYDLAVDHEFNLPDIDSQNLIEGSGYVLITGLQAGWYDVYVYGHDGQTFYCAGSGSRPGNTGWQSESTNAGADINAAWAEGNQYVKFRVKASPGLRIYEADSDTWIGSEEYPPAICVLMKANPPGVTGTRIAGIQIVRVASPGTAGYGYNCYGEGCLETPPPAQHPDADEQSVIE